MATIVFPSKTKAKEQIYKQFPPVSGGVVSQIYEIEEIEYERQRIKKYDVLFWHRLLRTIYQEPSEIECALYVTNKCNKSPVINLRRLEENSEWKILNTSKETALKIQSGKIKPIPINWKYFISLSDSGIIVVGTKDQNTVLYFAHILSGQVKNEDREQAKKFISLLLDEAKKVGNQLFNPIEEFKKNDNLKLYHLFNVYRANYVSAEFMLSEALTQEKVFRKASLRSCRPEPATEPLPQVMYLS